MMHIYNNSEALYKGFTRFLAEFTENYPHLNLALSGGNTPKALFDYWAEHAKNALLWDKITFFWGDERCVAPEDEMSNYGMTSQHLFSKIPAISLRNVRRVYGENEPEAEALRYASVIDRMVLQRHQLPCFELIMLGLGDDGHTASIFPNQIEKWNDDAHCVVTQHPQTKMKRVSFTGQVINNARDVAFLVTGKGKAEIVRRIVQEPEKYTKLYPAALVKPTQGKLHWFLDEEAAALL